MILVVGGDSRLSKEFISIVGIDKIIATTRRHRMANEQNRLFLDLLKIEDFIVPKSIEAAVIIGGITTFDGCSENYNHAYNINCKGVPAIVKELLLRDIYTCFISSNSVFMNTEVMPGEGDKPSPDPKFVYANMKYETERKIKKISKNLDKEHLLSILRITKNIDVTTRPFDSWIEDLSNGRQIYAFTDLYFSPIRYSDSVYAIREILNMKKKGVFHLSGERDISYSDFAINFVRYLGLDEEIVKSVPSSELGVSLFYNPCITGLNMEHTKSKLGLIPIPLTKIYKYFLYFF